MESNERGGGSEPELPEIDTGNDHGGQSNAVTDKVEEQAVEEENNSNRMGTEQATVFDRKDMLKAIEVVERDSLEIAQSYTSLFASLRSALSQATSTSIDHVSCFSDAAGHLQECALDATTKGSRYINSCLRLNEEIKRIPDLALKLKELRRAVDALDSAVTTTVRLS